MAKYYDVVLTNRNINSTVHYIADSFIVTDNRILKVFSTDYGNVFTHIRDDEVLTINEIESKDEDDW